MDINQLKTILRNFKRYNDKGVLTHFFTEKNINLYAPLIQEQFDKRNFNIRDRLFMLSNNTAETGCFNNLRENLNYSAGGLLITFPSYFKTMAQAKSYERQPQKIANFVYANRFGNGSEASGDGFKYRGAGFLQTTFKTNFETLRNVSGLDVVNNPSLLENPSNAVLSAFAFWDGNKLSSKPDLKEVRRSIAGSLHAYTSDVLPNYNEFKKQFDNLK